MARAKKKRKMTAATLTRLPLVAGGTLLGSLGRGAFWAAARVLDFGFWGLAQFMRAPVAVSTVTVVVGLAALASANALYFQHERHPAPLFFSPPKADVAPARVTPVTPVLPRPRPKPEPVALDLGVTGSIPHDASQPITTADVKALQSRLIAMKFLSGEADGIYGPHTAFAIRSFESRVGMHADGKITPALLAAVQNATVPLPNAVAAAPATAEPVPPAAIPAGPVKPVPLAPLPAAAMTVSPVAAPPRPAAPPAAPAAATTVAAAQPAASADTFAANSLPVGSAPPAEKPAAPAMAGAEQVGPGTADPASLASAELTAAQRLAAQFGTLPPAATTAEALPDIGVADDSQGSTDPALITKIQKGLASLGFLADRIDGVPGEGTAKAIRNFQVFYNYKVTGLATHQLLRLLVQHGATI
jgi:peptidoglycan hydrolase-like protein with peptidoglycan-binding domain